MTNANALSRLRGANPVPSPTPAEDEALFSRITSLPRETRPRRSLARRRGIAVVAIALVAAALVASTAFAISQWFGGNVVKPHVTRSEYRQAQAQLTLPPGDRWPVLRVDSNSVTGRGAGGGHAVLIAENAWQCYWADALRTHDTAAAARAQSVLESLLRNNTIVAPAGAPEDWLPATPPPRPFVIFARDGGYEWLRDTYALAAAGHPQRLVETCRANAPG